MLKTTRITRARVWRQQRHAALERDDGTGQQDRMTEVKN